MDLTDAAAHWAEHGYVFLPGYLESDDVAAAQAMLSALFPTAQDFHDDVDPSRNARYRESSSSGIVDFPFAAPEIGLLAVHPLLVELARACLRTDDVFLYGCEAWAKYAGAADYEQTHHRDYTGHTVLVPSDDVRFRQLEVFVYLTDVDDGCAPPRYVSRTRTAHLPALPRNIGREEHTDLYEHEAWCTGPAGSVVAWEVGTFHRAVDFTDPTAARFTLHSNFRAAGDEWGSRHRWGYQANGPDWYRFVERATPEQLRLFGFPPPGHPYWTEQTLAQMAVRYPTLDLTPWRT